MTTLFSGFQRTQRSNAGPGNAANEKTVRTATPRGVPATERRAQRYQEWVALQPLWLIVTLTLPQNALVIYACVPAAVAIVWAWRRRWLLSPTSIGLTAFPTVFITARLLEVHPGQLIVGDMIIHKIIVSVGMITCYFVKLAVDTVKQLPTWVKSAIRWFGNVVAEAVVDRIKAPPGTTQGGIHGEPAG